MKRKDNFRRRPKLKGNRLWSDKVYTWSVPTTFALVLIVPVILLVAYAITYNSCSAIKIEIGSLEDKQTMLANELHLEVSKWKAMQTPANLERRLHRHGMAMSTPNSGQRVAMSGRARMGGGGETTVVASN
ncbi:MAG: hypothetical protein ACOX9C_11550 [Kiritimatiellia bacterium]|jgi:hypothetical protein